MPLPDARGPLLLLTAVTALTPACDDVFGGRGAVIDRALLDTPLLLAGVVIGVEDGGDENLGNLKIRASAYNATARFDESASLLRLSACIRDCGRGAQSEVLTIPVLDTSEEALELDLTSVAESFAVSSLVGDEGLSVEASSAALVDADDELFIFDVEAQILREQETTSFGVTVRWTLARPTMLHRDFALLGPREDIGLFTTQRSAAPLTTRWRLEEPVHFFVKGVPDLYIPAFRSGFDIWNVLSQEVLGRDIVSYEFIPPGDPREASLVTGDIRANVVEWDTTNVAAYGGIGPRLADPATGEIFWGAILVQGPGILELYRDWFDIDVLDDASGQKLLGLRRQKLGSRSASSEPTVLHLGELEIRAAEKGCDSMEDRVTQFFEDRPPEVTFEDYMFGYFRNLVAHEIGHTLGLGHNFMGSLADDGAGPPTSSVMEYVWRGARHRGELGDYDAAALRFAYGAEPVVDVPPYCIETVNPSEPTRNAECSAQDGQADPYGYFLARIQRVMERAIRAEAVGQAPIWTFPDLIGPLSSGMYGALFYASSAAASADRWRRFHLAPDRPTDPGEIETYVLQEVEAVVCGSWVSDHIEATHALDPEAGIAAAQAWSAIVQDMDDKRTQLELPTSDCAPLQRLSFSF